MSLKFTIPNKAIHALIAIAVLLFVTGAIAYTASVGPIPPDGKLVGHALANIQGYFLGDTSLRQSLGKFCQADGTNCPPIGSGDITAVNGGAGLIPDTCTSGDCTLNVNTGTVTTTGIEIVSDQVRLMDNGCIAGEVLKRNSSNNGWICDADAGFASGTSDCVVLHQFDPAELNILGIFDVVPVPDFCKNGNFCHIFIKRYYRRSGTIYDSDPNMFYQTIYTQFSHPTNSYDVWMKGDVEAWHRQGDSTSSYILGNARTGLLDDRSGSETDASHWVFIINSDDRWAGELIVCPI